MNQRLVILAALAGTLILGACSKEAPEPQAPAAPAAQPEIATAKPELDPATGLVMAQDWRLCAPTAHRATRPSL